LFSIWKDVLIEAHGPTTWESKPTGEFVMEEKEGVVIITTYAGEDPERATIAFVMGNAALAMDEKSTIVLQGGGVFLAKKGFAEHVCAAGFDPLKKLMDTFVDLGGSIFVCVPCIKARNIQETDLIEKAQLVAAGSIINECCNAKAVVSY
jgi:uncharacterized protein involved in oxidation of intracellular sulfur